MSTEKHTLDDPAARDNSSFSEKDREASASLGSAPLDDDDAEEERRLVKKLDRRILPILCLIYFFGFLDRSNLGNARLQGLPQDVLGGDPTGVLFDWVNSAFFFSYILVQIPATITSKFCHPSLWLGMVAIGWGICSTLMATAFNFGTALTARIGVGAFEAGFAPGMPLYLSFFYTKSELGLRMAWWFSFAAVASASGGLIAFGVQHAHAAISNWRLLFIIEGIPSILLGIVACSVLPDRPESTRMFNERERALALRRMNRDATGDVGTGVRRQHIYAAFRDWRLYIAGVIFFGLNCSLASLSAFLPTIIKTFGFTNAIAQLLTVPPYAVAAVVMTGTSYLSDRMQSRGLFMATTSVVSGIGYVLLLAVPSNEHVRYFATFCITGGTFTTIGVIISWFAHNLGSESKKATGIPFFMAIGQGGSILGSHIFPATEGPLYIKGFAISCALQFIAAFGATVLSISYRMENRRRDRLYGPSARGQIDTTELADKAPSFRYVP